MTRPYSREPWFTPSDGALWSNRVLRAQRRAREAYEEAREVVDRDPDSCAVKVALDEVERLRVALMRLGLAFDRGEGNPETDLRKVREIIGLIFDAERTEPISDGDRRELAALATMFTAPPPGPPLRPYE